MIRTDHLGPLSPGARVALVAPSGPPVARRLEGAVDLLTQLGLDPVVLPSCTAAHPRAAYLAGADEVRAADVQQAWCDPAIDGIVCVRGGYGAVRVLDLLDAEAMARATPKPLYGSSDITALHEWLRGRLGVASWFTPMPATGDLADDPVAIESFRAALLEPWPGRVFRDGDARTLVGGRASGTLVGGNLSLLAMTLAAHDRVGAHQRDTLVLLEDVGEDIYKYDGYLQSLLRAGWFEGVRGIALGSWKGSDPAEARELCAELLTPLGLPMVSDLDFGHGPGAMSLPLGVEATLDADARTITLAG